MFKVGDKVKDKEYGFIVTIEDREYENRKSYWRSFWTLSR